MESGVQECLHVALSIGLVKPQAALQAKPRRAQRGCVAARSGRGEEGWCKGREERAKHCLGIHGDAEDSLTQTTDLRAVRMKREISNMRSGTEEISMFGDEHGEEGLTSKPRS